MAKTCLLLACGALAHELAAVARLNDWRHIRIRCLPPELHNRPNRIPGAVRKQLEKECGRFEQIFVAYGDCGTAGELDKVLEEFGVERLPGAHCYEFYAGSVAFAELVDEEPGTYYVTDFLVRQFDRIVRQGLDLDKRPELLSYYFGNYKKLVYLAQRDDADLQAQARAHAEFLGLDYDWRLTGVDTVGRILEKKLVRHAGHADGWRAGFRTGFLIGRLRGSRPSPHL